MSQQALADALFVSRDLVSKWESGSRTPDYPTVERIAGILGVQPDWIVDKRDLVFEELSECVVGSNDIPQEKLVEILNAFVRSLNQRNAGVFMDRYYHLKTTSEIADVYRIGDNHVRSILSKIRKQLRKYIKESIS